jgi:hypothetical protein
MSHQDFHEDRAGIVRRTKLLAHVSPCYKPLSRNDVIDMRLYAIR